MISRCDPIAPGAPEPAVAARPSAPRRRRTARLLGRLMIFLLLGAGATVIVALACTGIDVLEGPERVGESVTGEQRWTVHRWDRPGATAVQSIRDVGYNWSASQATGPPDTSIAGDQVTAWASATPDGQR